MFPRNAIGYQGARSIHKYSRVCAYVEFLFLQQTEGENHIESHHESSLKAKTAFGLSPDWVPKFLNNSRDPLYFPATHSHLRS